MRRNPMSRLLLLLSTLVLSSSALAQWSLLGRNENLRVYLDQTSIQRNGDIAQMWQLYDYTTAQWVGTQTVVMSVRNLVEYDCRNSRSRTIAGAAYSEQMGGGRVVMSENAANAEWVPIPPGGTAEQTLKVACGNN